MVKILVDSIDTGIQKNGALITIMIIDRDIVS